MIPSSFLVNIPVQKYSKLGIFTSDGNRQAKATNKSLVPAQSTRRESAVKRCVRDSIQNNLIDESVDNVLVCLIPYIVVCGLWCLEYRDIGI